MITEGMNYTPVSMLGLRGPNKNSVYRVVGV